MDFQTLPNLTTFGFLAISPTKLNQFKYSLPRWKGFWIKEEKLKNIKF